MNTKILGFLLGVISFTGCTSMYKSGQTPDDVYYSESRQSTVAYIPEGNREDGYVTTNRGNSYNPNSFDQQYDNYSWREDQFLRMQVRNRWRMGSGFFNDFSLMDPWYYNNWQWNSFMVWNSPWNSPMGSSLYWNSFYNPFCSPAYPVYGSNFYGSVINKGPYIAPSRPSSNYNFSNYMKTGSNSRNYNFKNTNSYKSRYGNGTYINTNSQSTESGRSRRSTIFSNDNNSFRTSDQPTRSYNPSNNSNPSPGRSSGSGSSGSGGSRPVRNGGGK